MDTAAWCRVHSQAQAVSPSVSAIMAVTLKRGLSHMQIVSSWQLVAFLQTILHRETDSSTTGLDGSVR